MNILCVANEFGESAAGIVYETIVKELAVDNSVYILYPNCSRCIKYNCVDSNSLRNIPYNINWRLSNLSATILGCNIVDVLKSKKLTRTIDLTNIPKIDFILSFVSQQKYFGLMVGRSLSKRLRTKWAVYSVDAIPAPFTWDKNYIRRRNVSFVFRKLTRKCDLFMSANPQMLQYQLEVLRDFQGRAMVLYTPTSRIEMSDEDNINESPVFLFAGNVYGRRRIDVLLKAFRLLVSDIPEAKLIFVGQVPTDYFTDYNDLIQNKNIEIHAYTKSIEKFYKIATVLLDINADTPNDVFLSSKIINYLSIHKPIVCISGENSPAQNLFTLDDTIFHCLHNVESILSAMKKAIECQGISEMRNYYKEKFSAQQICKILIEEIHSIIEEYE